MKNPENLCFFEEFLKFLKFYRKSRGQVNLCFSARNDPIGLIPSAMHELSQVIKVQYICLLPGFLVVERIEKRREIWSQNALNMPVSPLGN